MSYDSLGNVLSRVRNLDDDADGTVDSTSQYDATYTNECYIRLVVHHGFGHDGVPNYSESQESTFTWMCQNLNAFPQNRCSWCLCP